MALKFYSINRKCIQNIFLTILNLRMSYLVYFLVSPCLGLVRKKTRETGVLFVAVGKEVGVLRGFQGRGGQENRRRHMYF